MHAGDAPNSPNSPPTPNPSLPLPPPQTGDAAPFVVFTAASGRIFLTASLRREQQLQEQKAKRAVITRFLVPAEDGKSMEVRHVYFRFNGEDAAREMDEFVAAVREHEPK